jgi:hypothetical protein
MGALAIFAAQILRLTCLRQASAWQARRRLRSRAQHLTFELVMASKIRWLPSESWIRTTRNGQSFGKYAQSALTDGVNYIVFRQ